MERLDSFNQRMLARDNAIDTLTIPISRFINAMKVNVKRLLSTTWMVLLSSTTPAYSQESNTTLSKALAWEIISEIPWDLDIGYAKHVLYEIFEERWNGISEQEQQFIDMLVVEMESSDFSTKLEPIATAIYEGSGWKQISWEWLHMFALLLISIERGTHSESRILINDLITQYREVVPNIASIFQRLQDEWKLLPEWELTLPQVIDI